MSPRKISELVLLQKQERWEVWCRGELVAFDCDKDEVVVSVLDDPYIDLVVIFEGWSDHFKTWMCGGPTK